MINTPKSKPTACHAPKVTPPSVRRRQGYSIIDVCDFFFVNVCLKAVKLCLSEKCLSRISDLESSEGRGAFSVYFAIVRHLRNEGSSTAVILHGGTSTSAIMQRLLEVQITGSDTNMLHVGECTITIMILIPDHSRLSAILCTA
jgi:hypothetical protein